MNRILNSLIFFLSLTCFGILGFISSDVVFGFNSQGLYDYELCHEKDYKEAETIYSSNECVGCDCRDAGIKLFTALGTNSDCEDKENSSERDLCYNINSYSRYRCEGAGIGSECSDEYDIDRVPPYKYYLGEGGTFINREDFSIGGRRTYFNGFDGDSEHKIYSDFKNYEIPSLIFRKRSRDVEVGGSLTMEADLKLIGSNSGLYFNDGVDFGVVDYSYSIPVKDEYGDEIGTEVVTETGFGLIDRKSATGIESTGYLTGENDILIKANNKSLIVFPYESDTEDERRYNEGLDVQKSLEVADRVNIEDEMYFQNHKLLWSPPIRGHHVLYYK